MQNLNRGKSSQKVWGIFKKLLKVNDDPISENSPNQVTLLVACLMISVSTRKSNFLVSPNVDTFPAKNVGRMSGQFRLTLAARPQWPFVMLRSTYTVPHKLVNLCRTYGMNLS
jgi:hypothetical protein